MKRFERQWMYQRLDERKKIRIEFVRGVGEFIEFTKTESDFQANGEIRCPCRTCKNLRYRDIRTVKEHLYTKGFCDHYFEWYSHGEAFSNVGPSDVSNASNNYENMVGNAFPPSIGHQSGDSVDLVSKESNPKTKEFFQMLKAVQEPFYAGSKRTLLEMATRVINLKCEYNLAHRCVDEIVTSTVELLERMTRENGEVCPMMGKSTMEAYQRQNMENEQQEMVEPVEDEFHDAVTELKERIAANEREMTSMRANLRDAEETAQRSREFVEEMRTQMEFFMSIVREKCGSDFIPSRPNPDDPSSGGV